MALVDHLAISPMLIALATAVFTLLLRRYQRVQTVVSLLGSFSILGATFLVAEKARDTILVYRLGGDLVKDGIPFGILLEVDQLSAFMMLFSAFVMSAGLVYSVFFISRRGQRVSYHSLWHLLTFGTMGAFSTGDLFNLFVWFEVLLMSSYILVVFYSNQEATRSALYYVALNLVGSAVMLLAIGGIYASVGTLNLADMAQRVSEGDVNMSALYGLSSLLMITFVLKAGAVPLHFWVPETYPAAPAPVSAILAGVVKKVGVYGILRVFGTVLVPLGDFYSPVVLVIAVASALYGGWAALSRDDILEVLSYSSIAQVGFIFLGTSVGLNPNLPETVRVLAFTAVLIYSLNHAVIKSMLFLVAGHISRLAITTRFDQLGGLSKRAPVMSYSFFLGSIALIGVPPLNGFFGKLLVFDAGVDASSGVVVGVALASAILTILYLSRTWSLAFWSQEGDASYEVTEPRVGILIPIVVLTLLCIGIGVFFDPVFEYAKGAAQATMDTQAYIDAVLVGGIL